MKRTDAPSTGRASTPRAPALRPSRRRGIASGEIRAAMEALGLEVSEIGGSMLVGRAPGVYVAARSHARGGWNLANAPERNRVTRGRIARTMEDTRDYLQAEVTSRAPAAAPTVESPPDLRAPEP